jgi:hypothetical protein
MSINERRPDGETGTVSLWRYLVWVWVAFWLLMLAAGTQEYLWSGGLHVWRPLVDNSTAALTATALATIQMRRADRLDEWLNRPLHWFARAWAWMPLQGAVYIGAMYALRSGVYALAGVRFEHGPWGDVIAYEAARFVLFSTSACARTVPGLPNACAPPSRRISRATRNSRN